MPLGKDTRKLIRHGDSNVVTLPPYWCRFWELGKGGEVEVLTNSVVVVVPPNLPQDKKDEIKRLLAL